MSKNIIITNNNKGIGIINNFVDSKKNPIDITNFSYSVDLVFPDGTTKTYTPEPIDKVNGKVVFVLKQEHTAQLGLHRVYFNIFNNADSIDGSFVTAQNMITYFVVEERGGA